MTVTMCISIVTFYRLGKHEGCTFRLDISMIPSCKTKCFLTIYSSEHMLSNVCFCIALLHGVKHLWIDIQTTHLDEFGEIYDNSSVRYSTCSSLYNLFHVLQNSTILNLVYRKHPKVSKYIYF